MSKQYKITLTERQFQLVWDILDGAGDAGACEGGFTPEERKTLDSIGDKLLPIMLEINKKRRSTLSHKEG